MKILKLSFAHCFFITILFSSGVTPSLQELLAKYTNKDSGQFFTPDKQRIASNKKEIALTFDACGGKGGSGYDSELIDLLITNNIKATLFINVRWIYSNREAFYSVINNDNFLIASHGLTHRPLTTSKQVIYNINGTGSIVAAYRELISSSVALEKLTGQRPQYFRSGTAWYDELGVEIATELGYKIGGHTLSVGDYDNATTEGSIARALMGLSGGEIVLLHMNQPKGNTFEGMRRALPLLLSNGIKFVKLNEVELTVLK